MALKGAVASGIVGLLALVGMGAVFVANASPYMTVAEAKFAKGGGIHVAGSIDKSTLRHDLANRKTYFVLEDQGQSLQVVYEGQAQPNLATATTVVVIGRMEAGSFHATDMLLKCPSKYESSQDESGTPGS